MNIEAPHLRISQLSVEVFDRWMHTPQIAGGCYISTDTTTQDQRTAIAATWDVINGKLAEVHISVDGLFALCLDEVGYFFEEYIPGETLKAKILSRAHWRVLFTVALPALSYLPTRKTAAK